MIVATNVGVPLLVALVVGQWWSRIDRTHVRHTCIAAGLSFLIGLGLNQIILLFVHRVRPYDAGVSHLIISKSPDWSFPSDHATASIAIVATFALRLASSHASFRTSGIANLLVAYFCRHSLSDRCPWRQPHRCGRGHAGMGLLSGGIPARSLCDADPVTNETKPSARSPPGISRHIPADFWLARCCSVRDSITTAWQSVEMDGSRPVHRRPAGRRRRAASRNHVAVPPLR